MKYKDALLAAGREYLWRTLKDHRWRVAPAAVEAGVTRQCFYKLMERHGLSTPRPVQSGCRFRQNEGD